MRPRTRSSAYESDVTQFLDFAAQHLGTAATWSRHTCELGTIRAFMAELYRQGHARTSVARKLSALRAFGRYLRREGWIDDRSRRAGASPRRERKVPAHLSIDEMTRLLEMPDVVGPARPPRSRHPRAVLCLGAAAQRARGTRSRGRQPAGADGPRDGQGREGAAGAVQHGDARSRCASGSRHAARPALEPRTLPRAESREPRAKAARARSREPLFVNFRGARVDRAQRAAAGRALRGGVQHPVRHQPARAAALVRHAPARSAAPTCGPSRSCSGTCSSPRRSATRTSTPRSCWTSTGRRIRARSRDLRRPTRY